MAGGPWTDLTRPLHEGSDRAGRATAPALRSVMNLAEHPFAMSEMTLSSHVGTHLDAPSHFVAGGESIDAVALERVTGPGVVLDVPGEANAPLAAADLAAGGPEPRPGDIVLLRTGWEERQETPAYFEHPYLAASAVGWLLERRIGLLGMDLITPEMPEKVREGEFTWPVHNALMAAGVLVLENACNMGALARRRVEVMAAPIPVVGADGAPVRLLARPL
ncbi:MAG TPA: cyclase family protein [Solirubrobacterales bacterium]|nr:cyclase family protein [Solirubrobacterales bacterium]